MANYSIQSDSKSINVIIQKISNMNGGTVPTYNGYLTEFILEPYETIKTGFEKNSADINYVINNFINRIIIPLDYLENLIHYVLFFQILK